MSHPNPPVLDLPVLDLSLLDDGPEAAARFRDELRAATHDVGFFYLTGTGVTPELEARLNGAARDFFALPEADKLAIENVNSPHFRGYTRIGGERTQGRVDWREQIDIGPERAAIWAHAPGGSARRASDAGSGGGDDPDAPDWARLIGPNLWPAAQPELRDVVQEWQDHLTGVARRLLRAWALALGAEESYFDDHFGDPSTLIKIVRYPGTTDPEPAQGVGAHKDSGVLTLLWVEPGKGGLQVERDGTWVDAPSVPGAFVVNTGELLEYATQGYLKATNHRVVSPRFPEDRISVPFFFDPALDRTLPLIELPAGLAAQARGVTDDPANPIHSRYGENALKSRLRAHPDVAARWHADLVAARA
jgi:isopenicillin N synthase-like dioxygenase